MNRHLVAVLAGALFSIPALAQQPYRDYRDQDRTRHVEGERDRYHDRRGRHQEGVTKVGEPNPYEPKVGAPNPYATRGGDPNPYATRGGTSRPSSMRGNEPVPASGQGTGAPRR
jgi:hypothetical protein